MDKYSRVQTLSDGVEPDQAWLTSYRAQYPCFHPEPEIAVDIRLGEAPEGCALDFALGAGNRFARIDLLEALGDAVDKYLTLADVFDSSGKKLNAYRSIGAHKILEIRGDRTSDRVFCPQCHRFQYSPLGKKYLLRASLTGQPLYYAHFGPLVVNEELYDKLRGRRWPKLRIRELSVREEPLDGLPIDLSQVKPEDIVEFHRNRGW